MRTRYPGEQRKKGKTGRWEKERKNKEKVREKERKREKDEEREIASDNTEFT